MLPFSLSPATPSSPPRCCGVAGEHLEFEEDDSGASLLPCLGTPKPTSRGPPRPSSRRGLTPAVLAAADASSSPPIWTVDCQAEDSDLPLSLDNARREVKEVRLERDPEVITRLLIGGRDAVNQELENLAEKQRQQIEKDRGPRN